MDLLVSENEEDALKGQFLRALEVSAFHQKCSSLILRTTLPEQKYLLRSEDGGKNGFVDTGGCLLPWTQKMLFTFRKTLISSNSLPEGKERNEGKKEKEVDAEEDWGVVDEVEEVPRERLLMSSLFEALHKEYDLPPPPPLLKEDA